MARFALVSLFPTEDLADIVPLSQQLPSAYRLYISFAICAKRDQNRQTICSQNSKLCHVIVR
jgi:hypothetical protein